jgi:hypothetical protein
MSLGARHLGGRRRRLRVLGLSVVLVAAGGASLAAAALSGGRAGADTTLGGFTVSALAEASTAQYEQPNFPLPANPSLEFDEGYAATTDNFGPSGTAVAGTLYPGQTVANSGPEVALLVPGAPVPPLPVWPVEAVSEFPQTPNTASTDQPGANMDATSSADSNTATATLGDDAATAGSQSTGAASPSGSGNPLASSSDIFGIGESSGTSTSSATTATAVGTATATDSGISVLGGFITIGEVTSTATATSDGTTGTLKGSTVVSNVNIAGDPFTVDSSGIHADGQNAPLALPVSQLNSVLGELGITMSVTNPTDTVNGASASRTEDGLKITVNLQTLDAAADKFSALLPSKVIANLPLAVPDGQVLTLDLGTVSVNSAASPAFVDDYSAGVATAAAPINPGAFSSPSTFGGGGDTGLGTGTTGTNGSPTGTSGPGGAGSGEPSSVPTSAVTPVFTGIGSALVLLGLLAAAALAFAVKRVDDASELSGAGTGCAAGDPLHSLFSDAGDLPPDGGGVGA